MATDASSSDVASAAATQHAPALIAPPDAAAADTQFAMDREEILRMVSLAAATNGPRRLQSTAHCMAVLVGGRVHGRRTLWPLRSTPPGGGEYTPGASVMLTSTSSLLSSAT